MPRYLMIKHYRGGRPLLDQTPMTAAEFDAHVAYMRALADRLRATGEFVWEMALTDDGEWVRWNGEAAPPLVESPIEESKALMAGFMAIEVADHERAVQIAAELSAAPGPGGRPLGEWLELRRQIDG